MMRGEMCKNSKIKDVSVGIKAVFAMSTLFACTLIAQNAFSLSTLIIMSGVVTIVAGIPAKRYIKLMIIPLPFIVMAVVSILFSPSDTPNGVINIPIFSTYLVATQEGIALSANIFLKSLASVSCLYFFITSTSIGSMIALMKKMRLPSFLVEIILMFYRFIYVIIDMYEKIVISQKSRLGEENLAARFRSAGILVSTIFAKSLSKSLVISNAMDARLYNGEMTYEDTSVAASKVQIVSLLVYEGILVIVIILMGVNF